ncbi:MAG: hypothetical protein COW19_04210 [Zetaproteobacteria bacterium CG12_big_fil_rev_8_21_14_0_65_55_1124]|nr:MAG: hypothetical protein COT53_10920 [Zetaproteobacteria bacterium CG08_land_8_20_14_0_20_55_17]PIW43233.1 MAG: hypothetical protein COW19_04210 [Zetaproteobacteria bacterium CG12_big_fil_rev_8_21_14_0_65_55_1124]PIY51485.1 MAG: hypothetical protein COZ01_10955 [Zetaproteobacteria bacterium CG_4_10_14_0_8_um_filter_55_43]PIZ39654.1 MAG: hypothetical protein COY36_02105 [Zetaproteobacteria bacterium CG_4_10_14_0_2_um_filter_55_20]PJB80359.1 MAG: hypothetical protein CO089_07560 [Zetaproteoba
MTVHESKPKTDAGGLLATRKFPILRRLSSICLAMMLLTATALTLLYWQDQIAEHKTFSAQENEKNLALIKYILDEQITAFAAKSKGVDTERLLAMPGIDAHIASVLADIHPVDVLKLKVFNLSGIAIYSTVKQDIGKISSHPDLLAKALLGETAHQIEFRDAFSGVSGVLHDIHIALTYSPLMHGGQHIGIIEIYRDITPLHERRLAKVIQIALIVFGAFALLYAVLILIVFRMDRAVVEWQRRVVNSDGEVHQAQDATKASNARFQVMAEESPLPLQIFSPDGRTLLVNKAWQKMWGVPLEALSNYNVLHDQQLIDRGMMPYIRKAFAGEPSEIPAGYYDRAMTPEVASGGGVLWVRGHIYPIKDSQGEVSEVVLIQEDVTEHKQLESSMQKYSFIANASQDFMNLIDRNYVYQSANDAFLKERNLNREDVIGRTVADIWGEETFNSKIKPILDQCFSGHMKKQEFYFTSPSGETLHYEARFYPFFSEKGKVELTAVFTRDITERKQTEAKLEESMARYDNLVQHIPVGVYLFRFHADGSMSFEYVSPVFCQLLGLDEGAVLSDASIAFSTVHPDDLDSLIKSNTDAKELMKPFRWEGRFIIHGETRWIQIKSDLTAQGEGESLWSGAVSDITEHKQAEITLQQSEEQLRHVIAGAALGYWDWDFKTGAQQVNDRWLDILGLDRADIANNVSDWEARVHPDDKQRVLPVIEASFTNREPYTVEFRMKHKDGHWVWIQGSGAVISYDPISNEPLRVCGTHQDISERKQVEENLQLTQFVSDHAPECIVWVDEQAKICYVNEAECREHGYTREELLGMSIPDMDPDFPIETWPAHWQELKQKGSLSFETQHSRKDGSVFPVEVAANFVKFGDKEYNVAFVRNISARKLAEDALREHTQQLQEIQTMHEEAQRIAQVGHWQLDLVNNVLIWSNELYRIFGMNPSAPETYDAFLEIVHPDDRELVNHAYSESIKNRTQYDIEHRLLMQDGSIKWVHERCLTSYSDEDGAPLRSIGTTLDITERKASEGKARMLLHAIEHAGESMMITDRNAILEYVNPAFSKVTGYSPEEILGKTPAVLKSQAQDQAFYKELWDTITRGEVWNGTLVDRRKDGSFYPAMMSVAPIHNSAGETTHYVAIQQDMSEYKKMEDQFLQAQKMEAIGTLVGGIAHDFNNMLAAIQGNVYLAKRKLKQQPEVDAKLDGIEQLGKRAADMVKQLLTFARKDRMKMSTFSLNTFIKEGFQLVKAAIPENIELACDICQEELTIAGDATQLQQVLMNLLNNARDAVFYVSQPSILCSLKPFVATAAFGKVHPETKGKRFAKLSVGDNGQGIEAECLEKVFEPFFTTKGIGEGTGLGLAMVYGAVQSHGGIIEVESEKGVGSAFHIYLPLTEKVQDSVQKDAGGIVHGSGETILLVDDEEDMRVTSGEVLKDMGYQVLIASDGEDALQMFSLHQNDIRLVISDIVMPKMGGIELAKAIRRLDKKLPIIFATGYAKDQAMSDEDQVENSTIISKPFSYKKLSQLILKLIGHQ